MKPKCEDCYFWFCKNVDEFAYWGQCRRNPPTSGVSSVGHPPTWPVTHLEDWCGEFNPKPPTSMEREAE